MPSEREVSPATDHATHRRLAEVAAVAAGAVDESDLLARSLPVLMRLSGARSLHVLRRAADTQVVSIHVGASLSVEDIDVIGARPGVLVDVPVPHRLRMTGAQRVALRTLPGHAGVLAAVWAEPGEADESFGVGLSLLDAALSRVQAEHELSDLLARVDNAQHLANMGDYDWHIASDTNRWSDQLYRIYGHEPQSFNASYERFLAQIHPDDREKITAVHQHAYATGEPYEMVERIVRPGGEIRYLASNGEVIMDDTRTPTRMRGTCIDITDRVLAEQARERVATRFRALVESSPDAILVYDRAQRVVQASGHATELLGADPVGRSLGELAPWTGAAGQALDASGLDGRPLRLDVTTARLSDVDDEGLVAAFLRDAAPRLASESVAATLREAQVRRRQALEINDNVMQGLTAAVYSLKQGDVSASTSFLERTLTAARKMMNDWLDPLNGEDLQPGDLVREFASTLDEPMPPQHDPSPEPSSAAHRILIVDDNDDVRRLLRIQLERLDKYDIVGEAVDGEDAVAAATELKPDVVLLDLAMPRMDGLQALPLILDAVPGVQVIVLSGFDADSMAPKALAAGAARYIEKGLRMDLGSVIDSVLQAA
jgi:PAS domain S-box-containing protein